MSIALDLFCCIVELIMLSLVEFSICTGVGGCVCPIYSSVMHRGYGGLAVDEGGAALSF